MCISRGGRHAREHNAEHNTCQVALYIGQSGAPSRYCKSSQYWTVMVAATIPPPCVCCGLCWLGGAAGMLTMRRLQAPARHEPDIDQHQRRALCALIRKTPSYVQKRAATQPLRGRFGTIPVI